MKNKASNTKKLQQKINRDILQPRFSHLLRHPAWKWSGLILKGKDKGEVNKKYSILLDKNEKYKPEIKEASDKVNKHI